MKTVSDWLAQAVRPLTLALALLGAGTAHSAITFDNTPSGGAATSPNIELIRDTVVGAPSGQYIGLALSSNVAITNVYARAIVGGTGYALDATETANHFLGDLNATAKTSYWYINIPNTAADGNFTVEVYAGGPPGAGGVLQGMSPVYTLRSADVDQSAAANKIASVVINGGNPIVLGQAFDAVVCYDVNSSNGTNVLVNPASTAAFDPTGLRLLDVLSIQMFGSAGCTGTLTATYSNRLYYTGIGSGGLNALRVTYRFRAVNPLAASLSPIVSSRSGQYKYNADFSSSTLAAVPAASNTVVLAKSVNIANSPGATRVTYTLTASNGGSAAVTLDSFVDTLPASPAVVSYVTGSSAFNGAGIANPLISGNTLTWGDPGGANAFSIPAGGSRSLTFQADIPANSGAYTNSAIAKLGSVTIDTTLATGDNAPATATTRVGPPQLRVAKTTGTPQISGSTATYTVTVSNDGGSAAAGVVLTDSLPSGFTYAATSAITLGGGATRTVTANPAVGSMAPAWSEFNIPSGGSVAITFSANVAAGTPDGLNNNSASVSTTTTPAAVDNFDGATQSSDDVTTTSAALLLNKTTGSTTVVNTTAGATASYVVTVSNSSTATATATGVTLTDALPEGFSYAATGSVVLNGGATRPVVSDPAVGAVAPAWGGFTIPVGASVAITFIANVAAAVADGGYDNSASATTDTLRATVTPFDGANRTDDNVTVTSAVLTTAKITSTPSVGMTASGATANYTITVNNSGTAAATAVKVTDLLAAGFSYGTTSSVVLNGTALAASAYQVLTSGAQTPQTPQWDTSPAGGFTVEPGQSLVIEFDAFINASVADGTYHNSVTTLGAAGSTSQFNGAAADATSDDVTVSSAVLAVSKSTSTPAVNMSGGAASAAYALTVANTGSAAATGVRLVDLLPAGFSYGSTESVTIGGVSQVFTVLTSGAQSPSSPQWDTDPSGGFTIPAGQSLVVVFNAVIDASVASGTYHNSARASGSARTITDFDGNASSADDVTVMAGVNVHGTVYADANHNTQRDAGEAGTGLTLYLKLVPMATPAGPASQVATAQAGTGAYAFGGVAAGQYTIVLDDNATLADVTPAPPAGWLGTEMGDGLRGNVVVTDTDLPNQNFGLFQGARLSGRVFDDSGLGGGTAHNGQPDGGESGIARATVRATDASGATLLDTAGTDGAGRYTLWLPLAGPASAVRIVQSNHQGWVSVSGAPGSTGGNYARASDAVDFNAAGGTVYGGVNFGDVRENTLAADGRQSTEPGSVVFYAHRFRPGSGGTVSFNLGSAAQPSTATGFTQLLLHDLNCNGRSDADEPVLAQNSPLEVQVGVTACVIVKDTVPTNAPIHASNIITLTANFVYTGASPTLSSTHANTDVTVVALASALALSKSQSTANVVPGATITYTLEYTNNGSAPLSSIRLHDATPAYTHFVAAECGQLGAGIGTCTVTRQPAPGAAGTIEWTLTDSLAPAASGAVRFTVRVDQ